MSSDLSYIMKSRLKNTVLTGVCLFLFYAAAFTQTLISGKVKDGKGKPVPGASISVKNSYDGATSDSSGNYHFSSSDTGWQSLTVSSIGYRPIEVTIHITGKAIQLDLQLKEELNELKAVTISAGTFAAGDSKSMKPMNTARDASGADQADLEQERHELS